MKCCGTKTINQRDIILFYGGSVSYKKKDEYVLPFLILLSMPFP